MSERLATPPGPSEASDNDVLHAAYTQDQGEGYKWPDMIEPPEGALSGGGSIELGSKPEDKASQRKTGHEALTAPTVQEILLKQNEFLIQAIHDLTQLIKQGAAAKASVAQRQTTSRVRGIPSQRVGDVSESTPPANNRSQIDIIPDFQVAHNEKMNFFTERQQEAKARRENAEARKKERKDTRLAEKDMRKAERSDRWADRRDRLGTNMRKLGGTAVRLMKKGATNLVKKPSPSWSEGRKA